MSTTLPLLLVADAASTLIDARTTLDRAGLAFKPWAFQNPNEPDGAAYRLVIIDSAAAEDAAKSFCLRWRARHSDRIPVLWLAASAESRLVGWQAGTDAVLARPFVPGELTSQVDVLLRGREERQRLAALVAESRQVNQSAVHLYQQVDADVHIARRIQRRCRPAHLAGFEKVRFSVCHRERSGGGGDFYNVLRVDEEHVAFFLGDLMGSSLTASLVSIFVHQNVTAKQIHGHTYRLLPPDEVLQELNDGLKTLGMPEPPLVRMTYGLMNARTGGLTYSCAGHTPPLYLPHVGTPAFWPALGTMLGDTEARHPPRHVQLQAGDRLLLFTDGLHGTDPESRPVLLAAAERRRQLALPSLIEFLTQDLLAQTPDPDDFTMLGVEFS